MLLFNKNGAVLWVYTKDMINAGDGYIKICSNNALDFSSPKNQLLMKGLFLQKAQAESQEQLQ